MQAACDGALLAVSAGLRVLQKLSRLSKGRVCLSCQEQEGWR